jgi:hypothetical protein
MTKIVTWQAPNGSTVNISRRQEQAMRKASFWPRNNSGEYCTVSHGLHIGLPTWTDAEIDAMHREQTGEQQ